jgi:hypothetical protein
MVAIMAESMGEAPLTFKTGGSSRPVRADGADREQGGAMNGITELGLGIARGFG